MNFFVNEHNCDYKILGWVKSNPMPMFSNRWLDDIEYCICFKSKNAKMQGYSTYNNSFKIYKGEINLKDKLLFEHPTIKPVECIKNHIIKTTKEEAIILDPFLGSGTTAVACKETNRQYIGFEIDEKYFNIAKDRLNGITQQERKIKDKGQLSIFDFMEN